jgi:parvulin-like peptidyl-prolyl isomerase
MIKIVNFEGVNSIVRKANFTILGTAFLAAAVFILSGCPAGSGNSNSGGGPDLNETAATVNGKAIKLEEIERVLKQQAQGQEGRLSPLELAGARLQILQSLIEQEVMYQKAEKEGTVPTEEEITSELNKRKTQGGLSQEEFDKRMKEVGETEASLRESLKKALAIQKLTDKITGKIEPPKDNEVVEFYNGNKEGFKNKRGAQLAAIVIDPADNGQGDTAKNDVEAQQKAKEVGQRVLQGADFATVARESSEESNTRLSGGDWRYFTEDEMKQAFGAGFADFVMNKMQNGQIIPQAITFEGKYLIVKLQRKQEKDEDRTLETPGVRQEITDYLVNARKQLLGASYQAIAMSEAKIENLLAKKVVSNPNELSGARPANAATPAANTPAANTPANTPAVNANSNANTNRAVNTPVNRPAANTARTNANR